MRKWTAAIFMLLVSVTLASCAATDRNSRTDMTLSSSLVSTTPNQTAVQTPTSMPTTNVIQTPNSTSTPVPTYAPGTELYGMLSVSGDVVVAPKYEYLDLFSAEGLARFKDHGLWGFVNEQGKEVIPAQYQDANNFSEGFAAVKVAGLYGFINVTGKMVIEPQFEGVQEGFLYDRCAVSDGKKIGLIDLSGKRIVETQYVTLSLYCEKYFVFVDDQGLYGIINRDGIEMIDRDKSEIFAVTDSGNYFVRGSDKDGCDLFYDFNGRYYYTEHHDQEYAAYQINSKSQVKCSPDGQKWGLFDLEKNTCIIQPEYDQIGYVPGDEYAITSIDGLMGVIRISDGKTLLGCEYLNCRIEYGYIVYQKTNRDVGVIDFEGNTVFEPIYNDIYCSPFGEFAIHYDAGSAIVNVEGTVLHSFPEYWIDEFIDSIDCWEFTRIDGDGNDPEHGYMNRDGSILIEPIITLMESAQNPYYPLWFVRNQYPLPLNPETYPLLVPFFFDNGKKAGVIINTSGYVLDYPLNNFTWFPYKEIIVFVNKDGLEGILSFDGKLILEPSDYSFVIDNIYDNSDYLVFTTNN